MSDDFWDAAAPLLADGGLDEGTIMGGPCVRASGEFVGMPHHEWVLVEAHDEDRWRELLEESIVFVTS